MKLKIGDLTNIRTGKLDANASSEDGQYPFFTCSKDPLKISTYTYDCECVLVAGNGDLNVKYYKGKFDAYQRTYIIEDNGSGRLYMPYLYYFMTRYVEQLRKQAIGGVIKYIKLGNLTNAEMELPTIEEQKIIVNIMEKAKHILDMKNQNIHNLNQLIQSRFVEMFGDPIINNRGWRESTIGEDCFVTKLAGFEYSKYIKYDNVGDVVMVKAQNVKNGTLNRKDLSFISNEVSDALPRSQLLPGDVVMTYVGANIGDVALIDDKYKYHLAPNVAKIRVDDKVYNSVYFMHMLMFLNSYIVKNSADTAKAALGMERIRKLKVFIPTYDLQNQFATFVHQVNKSKFEVQKSLEKTQLLYDSLMHEYFG